MTPPLPRSSLSPVPSKVYYPLMVSFDLSLLSNCCWELSCFREIESEGGCALLGLLLNYLRMPDSICRSKPFRDGLVFASSPSASRYIKVYEDPSSLAAPPASSFYLYFYCNFFYILLAFLSNYANTVAPLLLYYALFFPYMNLVYYCW